MLENLFFHVSSRVKYIFFMGEIHFFVRYKKCQEVFYFQYELREKKSRNVESKVKIQFREIPTFSEKKKIISLCSTSGKKSLVFSYSARHYKNK